MEPIDAHDEANYAMHNLVEEMRESILSIREKSRQKFKEIESRDPEQETKDWMAILDEEVWDEFKNFPWPDQDGLKDEGGEG